MKRTKLFLILILLVLITGCKPETYKTRDFPEDQVTIDQLAPDSIMDMQRETELKKVFLNDTSNYYYYLKIFYGNNKIVYEYYKFNYPSYSEEYFKDTILPNLKKTYEKTKKIIDNRFKTTLHVAQNDSIKTITWYKDAWILKITANQNYYDTAIKYCPYIDFGKL